jgi:hypothetical protein
MEPRYVAIGPGAMGFYALLGSLRNVDLSRVEEMSGSSAGANEEGSPHKVGG